MFPSAESVASSRSAGRRHQCGSSPVGVRDAFGGPVNVSVLAPLLDGRHHRLRGLVEVLLGGYPSIESLSLVLLVERGR